MNVLVTGGCGYIGSVLVPQLQADEAVDHVALLDNLVDGSPRNLLSSRVATDAGLTFNRGDVREYGDVESAMRDVDTVIHLAAITGAESTHERDDETYAVNLEGTKNVLTAAAKLDVDNVVFASSCNNYGRAASTDINEETDPEPLNPYAETKNKAEDILSEYVDDGAFDGTSLRMSTNYGYAPGIRFNLVVNHFVFRALTNRPLTVYGDGNNWRPFIHVEDAARAFKHAACQPDLWTKHVYNVGAQDENYQISDVAELVRDELETTLDISYLEEKHPGPSYHVNFQRLSETGFEPQRTLRDGIRELAEQFTQTNDIPSKSQTIIQ